MKLLLDQNLSHKLVEDLKSLYPDSQHVRKLGKENMDDEEIWRYASEGGLAVVSKDSDFYHRSMLLNHPPKVIWLRVGNCSTAQVRNLLRERFNDILAFEKDPTASLLILP
jgi:predicted nuclease of predicted toxin-antitoxin system